MTIIRVIPLLLALVLPATLQAGGHGKNRLFQYSTIQALLEGHYDGDFPLKKLMRKGDFGMGTFDRLDGEMIVLDGSFYQIRSDGKAYLATPEMKTPFAMVSFFAPDHSASLPENLDFSQLEQHLDSLIKKKNQMQAIRIDGTFNLISVRSIDAQQKPYKRLAEVSKSQKVYHYKNQKGTLIGYRFPSYMSQLNVPGYHFHFIDDTRKFGGHVFSLKTAEGQLKIDDLSDFRMKLPNSESFSNLQLGSERKGELEAVEKGK